MVNFFQNLLIKRRSLFRLLFFLSWDAILIILSVYLAFMVRFEGQIPERYSLNIGGIMFLSLVITIPLFYFSKLYYFSWLYVSTAELISLIKVSGLSFLILTAVFLVMRDYPIFTGFPRSTLFISYFFIFIFCGGIRFAKRIYFEIFRRNKTGKETTLIVGAGDAGEQILRNILSSKVSPYSPLGFIDDNPTKWKILIHGVTVLGRIEDIPRIVKEKNIETLIVALPSAGSEAVRRAVEAGRKGGLKKIKILPPIDEIINGKIKIGLESLREIEMEDLLGRTTLILETLSQALVKNFIEGKSILVTGAAGSIGSELSRQVVNFNPSALILLDQDETGIFNITEELKDKLPKLNIVSLIADIQDEAKIERIFNQFRPNIIFHAAAYKHVPLMEEHSEEAVKNNILGTKIVGEASIKNGVEKFVFISTDKAVNPTSVMGGTKRVGEMICQSFNQQNSTKFISVRFGNVLGSRGSVIPIFLEKIKKREAIEITHPEMKRYFMTTPEACLLVMQAGAMGKGGEVFVLDMGDPLKIIDLAKELIKLSGLEPDKDVPIVFTEPRPGEKFFEEILTAEEGTISTQNQKIFIAKLATVEKDKLDAALKKLKIAAEAGDKKNITQNLKEIVLNYKPKSEPAGASD